MSGPDPEDGPVDEFDWIDRCLRPLAKDTPEAFDLLDDAAAVAGAAWLRPGYLRRRHRRRRALPLPDDPADLIARKLLRVNLSDLAAKGAPALRLYSHRSRGLARFGWPQRRAFAEGLGADQAAFGLKLLGGDTTSTPGPLSDQRDRLRLGSRPAPWCVAAAAASPGDVVLVSGTIGDGWLGLLAACQGLSTGLGAPQQEAWLADRYRLPQPRAGLGGGSARPRSRRRRCLRWADRGRRPDRPRQRCSHRAGSRSSAPLAGGEWPGYRPSPEEAGGAHGPGLLAAMTTRSCVRPRRDRPNA